MVVEGSSTSSTRISKIENAITDAPQPPGFAIIFKHILLLIYVLFIVLFVLSSITLISRLTRGGKKKPSKKLSLRTRAEVYLTVSGIIQWIEAIQTFLSILSVIVFIYGTYITHSPPLAYSWIEIALTIFFTVHWILDYFISKDRLKYLFSFFSIVDLVTVLPIYIDISTGQFFNELGTFQFLRVLRTVRILRANRVLHYFNDITQYLFRVVIAIFTFIMIFAAFYMNIDVSPIHNRALQFHETIYFFVVTLTTDGYGDIHPTNAVGQITITICVVVGAVLIPYQVSRLLETLNSYSPYKRDLSKSTVHGHVILCGDINFTSLLEFLTEFYLEKYGQLKKNIVILSPNPPSDQLKLLLLHPFYKNRITYLEGSPMLENDLKRARYIHSSSCFIFRPLYWEDGDSTAVLTALAMKNLKPQGSKIFVQLLHHENRYKISARVKYIMCIEDFRNGILVQSTLCPGFGTLVCNLFTSRQPDLGDEDKWIGEYCNGSVNSIYKIPVPLAFVGETFLYVTSIMYSGAKALVLGYIDEAETNNTTPTSQPQPPTSPNKNGHHHYNHHHHGFKQKKNKFVIHPPFSTVLTSTMNLIIIAHSPSAPTFKPNVPSIIRKDLDDDEIPKTSYIKNIYNKLFVPDEIRNFQELNDSSDVIFNDNVKTFFTSTFTNNTIEMDVLSPPTNENSDSSSGSGNSPNQILIANNNNNSSDVQPLLTNPIILLNNNSINNNNENLDDINLNDDKISPLVALCNEEFESNWNEVIATVIESIDSKKAHMESIVEDLEPVLESIERNRNLDEYSEDSKEENNWKEHIIICGSINKIDLFIRGLRQKYISDNLNHFYHLKNPSSQTNLSNSTNISDHSDNSAPIIVILHPDEPDMSDWDDIDDVFYFKGSPLERKDLDNVKIHLASKIIILSDPYKEHHNSNLTDKTSVQLDSQTIMAFLEINEVFQNHPNPSSFLTVELVHEPNIRFISKNIKSSKIGSKATKKEDGEIEKPNYYITSEFASGKVLTLTTLDSLLCQANHQEYLLDVANELVLGVNGIRKYYRKLIRNQSDSDSDDSDYDSGDSSDSEDEHLNAANNTSSSSSKNNISNVSSSNTLSRSRNGSSTNLGYKNINSKLSQSGFWNHVNPHSSPNQCLLNQIKVPSQYHGHLYSELFETLIHKNILPLGLYRCKEITGAPNPYVFTCPPSDTILHENDLVYILYRPSDNYNH
ncbi:hypothetical protein DICPUDRAFT_74464 [Dictyostelium purpureum]|uniref:Ion transport domain-containing protein n=1 Tax=Dictyostelium purpureum TaxID=5786 RepID=F0Z7T9_DICPU|nr:uncharacterized protein DICPUDRAFT_74464 [Dictyostelium purpureum]EGC39966.1 hypothetical protein DICPUDRAFT_74464 [Dictyostelium purpureum]|eukprot:XP_003283469.1 hypothetical protein DICPUDRAFT_74464 [Dictyostelium purpureum]